MAADRVSTDVYLRTPETVLPQELVYGLVREAAAAPTPRHQWMVGEIFATLRAHLERSRAGRAWVSPIDVVLDRETGLVLQPDVVVMSTARLHLVTDRIWGAPDLVVEVLSPTPRLGRIEDRLAWFAHYGVRECWLVHQFERDVEILQWAGGAETGHRRFGPRARLASQVLPEFEATLEGILGEG